MIDDEERKRILDYEEMIAEISKRRNPSAKKSWWEAPGMLPSATAVITVALTSALAYCTQVSLRDKDFTTQQSKENYESEVAAVQEAHLLAAETLHWASERDRLLRGYYRGFDSAQKAELADSVNRSDDKWRQGRSARRVSLDLLFGGDKEVLADWDTTVARLNVYTTCTVAQTGCDTLRGPAESAIVRFRDSSVAYVRADRPLVDKH